MANPIDPNATLERLRHRYRLVVMNDDTYEEVVTFKLSRLSVYIMLCTVFVMLVGLTVALIVFTPLKYYIPGYGSQAERKDMVELKIRADSLEKQMRYREAYWKSIQNVLTGNVPDKLDTTQLSIPSVEQTDD
jgi:hypothetical protein